MRVVLVDPSRTAAKFVTRLLEARDHEVRCFADGREALDLIRADTDVAAVITSAEPLFISGLELCWETRLLATSHRPIYVIMMSSTSDQNRLIAALDSGADDFISKPPAPEELYARLRAAERLATMQRELIRLATTDSLTGAYNRRAFFDRAGLLCQSAEAGAKLSAVMADVDHFKRINDVYGHDVGDEAIRAVAHAMMKHDVVVGRVGGEEFALLLSGRDTSDALAKAERLRAELATLQIRSGTGIVTLTCSFGVSEWHRGDTIDRLLKRADIALYEAKLKGRNCVVAADHSMLASTYADAGRPIRSVPARAIA